MSVRELSSFAAMAGELAVMAAEISIGMHEGLKGAAEQLEAEIKSEFGVYQTGWAQLADATQQQRAAQGYTPNDPLLRDGKLRDSVSHEVEEFEAVVGSDSDIAVYQHLGTVHIPPRDVYAPALQRLRPRILRIMERAFINSGTTGTVSAQGHIAEGE